MMTYIDKQGSFRLENPQQYSYLYFPLANEAGMKSSITPLLGGDAKVSQNSFLLQPVSAEELHNLKSSRNYWCKVTGKGVVSLTGCSAADEAARFQKTEQIETSVEAGLMWHRLYHKMPAFGLESEILTFVPNTEDLVELTVVSVTNTTSQDIELTPVAAIPIYGRSADNIRDHRHVTSLLHHVETIAEGVVVTPTFTFDERGHKRNTTSYFVLGSERPIGCYPVVEDYIGEGGSFLAPKALYTEQEPEPVGTIKDGYEALGGLCFAKRTLKANETMQFITIAGVLEAGSHSALMSLYKKYDSVEKVQAVFEKTKKDWLTKMNVSFQTGEKAFDQFLYWVCFQPMLRRLYGCSFLPHHDYGKGGRGWRDLWQDCLALLMMNPQGVRQMLLDNFGGVRLDGTNATIIGTKQGEFKADRNNISRVWMDHGLWPYMTTEFYIHQTGDADILCEEVPYFDDVLYEKGETAKRKKGSVLEHILVQHLTSFYEVGAHNHMRLLDADWNDALDMAPEHGESVAFTMAYAGNLKNLAKLLEKLEEKGLRKEVCINQTLEKLLVDEEAVYEDVKQKQTLLQAYRSEVQNKAEVDKKVTIAVLALAQTLNHMADWIMTHIRKTEWIQGKEQAWFNSYYDNHANAVEGEFPQGVRMMLTGQVFAIMSKTATEEQVEQIGKAADQYLFDATVGGYKLNTDFKEVKEDLGRMFGFAYGHKENGAVFSHMTTMFGNALYQRGFVKEGYKALHTLYEQASDFSRSMIYPGIPEYFNDKGRGMYHYLTGAASWYMMTMITQVFGVRGVYGDLLLEPKLLASQFDETGMVTINLTFAQRKLKVCYENREKLDFGAYTVSQILLDGEEKQGTLLSKKDLMQLAAEKTHTIYVKLTGK